MNSHESDNEKAIIKRIRDLVGELGMLQNDLPGAPDHEEYDFQVEVGLAESVVEILDTDVRGIARWFGYCLIRYGVDVDDRIDSLLDALAREVEAQIDALKDSDENAEE